MVESPDYMKKKDKVPGFGTTNPQPPITIKQVGKGIINTPKTIWKNRNKNISPGKGFGKTSSDRFGSLRSDVGRGSGWWIVFAFFLYLSDIFFTRFDGFRIDFFLDVFLKLDFSAMVRIILNAGLIAVMVAYALAFKPDKREFFSFFVAAEILWFIFTFTYSSVGAILHFIFAICIWYFLLKNVFEDRVQANLLLAICVFVDFFLFSLISEMAPNLTFFNRLIIPIWFFVALSLARDSRFKKILTFFVIMFYVFNAFAVVNEWQEFYNASEDRLTSAEIDGATRYAKESLDNAINLGKSLWKQKANETLGEYYTGEIDENANMKLGVYLEDVQAADTKFYEDQPITIWGTIIAQTIDEIITANVNCKVDDLVVEGVDIFPSDEFEIHTYEEEGIECSFEPGLIDEGSHEISLEADFNFLTMAYIKTYFMDQETKRSFTREGIDPLDSYGITDKDPNAIHTSGPIQLGINVGKPPLSTEDDFRMGITLTNAWLGKLKEVTDMYIIMPSQVEMLNEKDDGFKCSGKRDYIFKKKLCSDIEEEDQGCDDRVHNVYRMELENKTIKDIEVFETILCRLKIDDSSGLLDGLPITTKYFKVATRYDYKIFEEVGISVKGGDNVRTVLDEGECNVVCTDKDGCLCPKGCEVDKGDEVANLGSCGGTKKDDKRTDLTSCTLICNDPDGCTCPEDCATSGDIDKNKNCGDSSSTETSTGIGSDYTSAPNIISFEINGGASETSTTPITLDLNVKYAEKCGYVASDTDEITKWETVSGETFSINGELKDERYNEEHTVWVQCTNQYTNSEGDEESGDDAKSDTIKYNPSP